MPGWDEVFRCIAGGCLIVLMVLVIRTDRDEITRRCCQAADLAAGAALWCLSAVMVGPGHAPSRAHPAAKAVQRCTCWGCLQELPGPAEMADWYALEQPFPAPRREA